MKTGDRPYTVGYVVSPHPHAPFHLKTLDALPEVEAVHLCGLEGAEVDELGSASAKVSSIATGLDELLARPDLDALFVCVRNDLCPGVLNAAVGAGMATLFEKPGAVRALDLRRIAGSAAERGIAMGALYLRRWSPVMKEVRQIRRDGALGRVMAVEARMVTSQVRYRDPSHWLFGRETAGSGILSWLACHYIDTMCFLMDERISEVTAMTGRQNPEPIEVEDTACVAFRFAGGALGTLNAGYPTWPEVSQATAARLTIRFWRCEGLRGRYASHCPSSTATLLRARLPAGSTRTEMSSSSKNLHLTRTAEWPARSSYQRFFGPPERERSRHAPSRTRCTCWRSWRPRWSLQLPRGW